MFFETWMILSFLAVVAGGFWHINRTAFRKGKVEGMYEIMIKLHHDGIIDFDDDANVKRPQPITVYK